MNIQRNIYALIKLDFEELEADDYCSHVYPVMVKSVCDKVEGRIREYFTVNGPADWPVEILVEESNTGTSVKVMRQQWDADDNLGREDEPYYGDLDEDEIGDRYDGDSEAYIEEELIGTAVAEALGKIASSQCSECVAVVEARP